MKYITVMHIQTLLISIHLTQHLHLKHWTCEVKWKRKVHDWIVICVSRDVCYIPLKKFPGDSKHDHTCVMQLLQQSNPEKTLAPLWKMWAHPTQVGGLLYRYGHGSVCCLTVSLGTWWDITKVTIYYTTILTAWTSSHVCNSKAILRPIEKFAVDYF